MIAIAIANTATPPTTPSAICMVLSVEGALEDGASDPSAEELDVLRALVRVFEMEEVERVFAALVCAVVSAVVCAGKAVKPRSVQ